MKKIIYVVVGIAIIALIAFVLTKNKNKNEAETAIVSQKNSAVAVRVDTVQTQNIAAAFLANGNFEPLQSLTFSAEAPGRVTRVLVEEGSTVRIGQTLAVIKGDRLSVDVQSARAAYQNATSDQQRYENAFKTGGVTQQQVDQAKLATVNAKARLDQANISFGDATIKSSINGIVNKRHIEPGSVVSPGTPLFDLVNVSKLKLRVTVTENQIANLEKGSAVKVKASVYPDKEFNGKISFIAPIADVSLNFPVEIEIENSSKNDLKAGMYGTAYFGSEAKQRNVRIVPRSAFVGSVNSNQIFIVENDVARLTTIVAGQIFGDKVEVLDGLKDGQIVVVSGQINLVDGTPISIIK